MTEIIAQPFEELFIDAMGATLDIQAKGRFWAERGAITRIEIAHAPVWTSQGYRAPSTVTTIEAGERGPGAAVLWALLSNAIALQFEHELAQTRALDQDAYVPIRISARVG